MSRNPILTALDALDDEPSAAFSEAMHARLFAELVHPSESAETPMVDDQPKAPEVRVLIDEIGTRTRIRAFEPRSKRAASALAAVAGIVLVAGLAVAVATRRSEPAASDTNADREIAEAALITVADLGSRWENSHLHDGLSTRDEAGVAAGVSGCSPYVDFVFDGPDRKAATSQRDYDYRGRISLVLSEVVSVFPSKAAASQVMNKVAEPTFRSCFAGYLEAAAPLLSPGDSLTSHILDAPPLLQHGDRQIAFESVNMYHLAGGLVPITSINIFIQIDRAIVYINPMVDAPDSLDPDGPGGDRHEGRNEFADERLESGDEKLGRRSAPGGIPECPLEGSVRYH